MHYVFKIVLLIVIFFAAIPLTNAQVEKDNLTPLLSPSDQKKVKKIDATFEKGEALVQKAQAIKENEKKYNLKRLEASQYYQSSNNDMINLMKDNIERFWKNNKTASIQPSVKNNEDKANELARKARSLRYVAEDLPYPNEKLIKIIEAEEVEKEAINIYIKVLYTYINYPIDYNVISSTQPVVSDVKTEPVKKGNEQPVKKQNKKEVVEYIPEPQKKDSLPVQKPLMVEKKDTSSLYSIIDVNEDQIDKFNKFLTDSFPDKYENYVINFNKLDYSDVESLKKAWHDYIFVEHPAYEYTPTEVALNDSSSNIETAAVNNNLNKIESTRTVQSQNKATSNKNATGTSKKENSVNQANTSKSSGLTSNKMVTDSKTSDSQLENLNKEDLAVNENSEAQNRVKENKLTNNQSVKTKTSNTKVAASSGSKSSKDIPNTDKNIENQNIATAKGFVYRVQISACRIPVDTKSIEGIYNGGQQVQELFEDNWYKYVIGEYSSYAEAKSIKQQINVPGAFVIAYLNGKRIKILKPASGYTQYSSQTDANINFKVQMAASKKPLSQKYLSNIYSGSNQIEELLEDEWYKYSISFGSNLKEALEFIESQNIPGAFITSYLGNNKIELKEALKINNSKK